MDAKQSTWVLLSTNRLPSATEKSNLLGAVVMDFKDPQGESEPEDVPTFMQSFRHLQDQSKEGNFQTMIQQGVSHSTQARLGDIVRVQFGKDANNTQSLRSTSVTTIWIKKPGLIFAELKKRHKEKIGQLLQQSLNPLMKKQLERPGVLYMIVGLKICEDASMDNAMSRELDQQASAQAPLDKIVVGATGFPMPDMVNPGISNDTKDHVSATSGRTFEGDRIFAVQYRVIMKVKQWNKMPWTSSRDAQVEMGSYATFSRDLALFESGASDEDMVDREELSDDELDIGSSEFTRMLATQHSEILVDRL